MVRKGMVSGMTLSGVNEYDHVCKGCALGKSHFLPFPGASKTQYERMDLVVADLSSPMAVPTWSGMLYALVVIEAHSRYIVCRLLKSKSEVVDELREIIAILEHQSGKSLKKLHTDNGTKFVNAAMDGLCK